MSETIDKLLQNSGLPGPRSNLSLLYSFAYSATESEVAECLAFDSDNLGNSPEEFVVACGVVGYCVLNKGSISSAMNGVRRYASHNSWRIREAVAMGFQEIAENNISEMIENLQNWTEGNDLEKRAVVAALCEPKLLKEKSAVIRILNILTGLTLGFEKCDTKLSDNQNSLRKALGYGWSVVIAALPDEGKAAFEEVASHSNKHIQWIVRENLKKNRLHKMDKAWVEKMAAKG